MGYLKFLFQRIKGKFKQSLEDLVWIEKKKTLKPCKILSQLIDEDGKKIGC